jgi:hypothetical protein
MATGWILQKLNSVYWNDNASPGGLSVLKKWGTRWLPGILIETTANLRLTGNFKLMLRK